ncbi:Solute carrier family 22 member 6-A [Amphibalanus amphitrite]|uniref:Solute carrier family 22 member 6-A n=1 Tax=Amphibalanus amphitrite TaxID=1232801 RepID=A0A6A4WE07_AMPAM|nr:Solute carrier family 22 member 6-A [Amphibalanus amphitrite]
MSQRKRFHVIVFALLALNFMFIPIHIFVDLFLSYEPKHYCAYPQGGSKYQWIPYNHETHAFESCAIYEEPLTKEMEKAEKKRIEEEGYHKDVKVWDWKALKFKSKHYDHDTHTEHYHDDESENGTESQDDGYTGYATTSEDHHRRRREQPPPADTPSDTAGHRFVTEDGRLLEPSEILGEALGVSDGEEEVTEGAQNSAGGPETATEVPKDVGVTTLNPEEGGDDETDTTPASTGSEVRTEAPLDEHAEPTDHPDEDHNDHDDGNHHDEDIIVHSFNSAYSDRSILGSGVTGSLAPEYDTQDTEKGEEDSTDAKSDENYESDGKDDTNHPDSPPEQLAPVNSKSGGHGAHDSDPDSDSDGDLASPHGDKHEDQHGDSHGELSDNHDKGGPADHGHGVDSNSDPHARESDNHESSNHSEREADNHAENHDDKHKTGASSKDKGKHSSYGHYGKKKPLHRTIECEHGIHYLADVGTTLITEYGLSCGNDVSVITNTVLGTAMVAGAIIFAPFVDKYGRKTLFMMVCCQNCLISLGIAFVRDIRSYWVLRFLSRFYIEGVEIALLVLDVGVEIALLVLAVEMAPSKSRPIAPLILYVAYAIGQILLSLQAMLFRSWWKLQLAISVESILLIPFSW